MRHAANEAKYTSALEIFQRTNLRALRSNVSRVGGLRYGQRSCNIWAVRLRFPTEGTRPGLRACVPEVFRDISQRPIPTSRGRLPQRPGRARGLARPDGARDAVHLRRPVADQDRPDVAVEPDSATPPGHSGKTGVPSAVSHSR